MTGTRARRTKAVLVGLATAAAVASCGNVTRSTDDPSGTSSSPGPSSPTASNSATTGPSPSSSPTALSGSLRRRLLQASDLPGFNARFTWVEDRTSDSEPDRTVTCNRYALTSIGAEAVAARTYLPKDGSTSSAAHLVATFPDAKTAKRAFGVLSAWRGRCGDRIADHDIHLIGSLTRVDAGDAAAWYLLTYGPSASDPSLATYDATGFVRSGDAVAVVVLRTESQDYSYASGREPIDTALRAAAAHLSTS